MAIGELLDDIVHPNTREYPRQRIFVVRIAEDEQNLLDALEAGEYESTLTEERKSKLQTAAE